MYDDYTRDECAERCFADYVSKPIFGSFEDIDDEWSDEDDEYEY